MSWLRDLADELRALDVPRSERRRILAEFHDHIASEPGCEDRLGDPHALATQFADELATDQARRSAFGAFLALASTAVVLFVWAVSVNAAGGYPGFNHGLSQALFWPALLGLVIGPQTALVAGTLAAWRALRRRRARVLPGAEIRLIRRRAAIGLGGGLATVAGLELYAINFSSVLPGWWIALVATLAGVAGAALLTTTVGLRRYGGLVAGTAGPAGDVFDDIPVIRLRWLRGRPWRLGAAACLIVGLAMTGFEWHAEHSLLEGLQRGVFEGLAAAIGFALLGRAIGVAPPHPQVAQVAGASVLALTPEGLAADEERARAERILRDGYADGRLSLEELTARVAAVHESRTVGELRAALRDLPGDR
jgi:hypothetical protein